MYDHGMNASNTTNCIYCHKLYDPTRGEGDHVIPVQLGQFQGDERFRRVCKACNGCIGKSEEQFLRCSPIAIYRRLVDPVVPNRRKRNSNYRTGSSGAPPPEYTIDLGDHPAIVNVSQDDPENVFPVDQLVIRDKDGRFHHIRLHPKMRTEQLEKQLNQIEIQDTWAYFKEDEFQIYSKLFKSTSTESHLKKLNTMKSGDHSLPGQIKCLFSEHYYRAIAKIAFHHFLNHTRRNYYGSEDCFESIRNFIANGGNKSPHYDGVNNCFAVPLGFLPDGRLLTSKRWHHIIAINENGPEIVGYVQLFLGPKGIRPPDLVRIAKPPSMEHVPSYVWGHVFTYEENQTGNWAGSVEQMDISTL